MEKVCADSVLSSSFYINGYHCGDDQGGSILIRACQFLYPDDGGEKISFIQEASWFPPIYIISGVWQALGWGTILYLAAITGINTELYEAARVDGANRFKQALHVTIPGIMPTIVTLLILDIGGIMGSNFEKIILLYLPSTYETADVISTLVYRMGITGGNFSYATAVGLFEGVIGLILVTTANFVSKKLTESSLW